MKTRMKPIEARYHRVLNTLRRNRYVSAKNKELEKDIAFQIKEIEDYGMVFFPNHFIGDMVVKLEAMVNQLIAQQVQ